MSDTRVTPGKTTIAPEVLLTIARLATLHVAGVSRLGSVIGGVNRFFRRNHARGIRIEVQDNKVNAEIHVILKSGHNMRDVSRNIQKAVSRAISDMVGMEVGNISVHIENIDFPIEDGG